jgi:5'-3' exonuclease
VTTEALVTVHLVDATYELFRAYFAVPPLKAPDGSEVGATRGVLSTLLHLVQEEGATHVGCATDHVIRSFRNDLYAGYKTEEGVDSALLAQFPLVEEAMASLGLVVWPMIEFEADDALATAAARFADRAEQVIIATVDKDLAQCVRGHRVVMLDRRRKLMLDEDGVHANSACRPRRSPTGSRWSATPPTAIRVCRDGGRSRPRSCSRGSARSTRSLRARATGT